MQLGCVSWGAWGCTLPSCLEQTFKNREELNSHVVNELRRVGVEWGIECTRYEVKDIDPPLEIMSAMKVRRCDAMRWVDGWVARRVVPAHPPIHHSVHPSLPKAEAEAERKKRAAILDSEGVRQACRPV